MRADEAAPANGDPPPSLARLLRLLDAYAGASSSPTNGEAAARFAAAAVKWARGAGAGAETLARLHLACAASLGAAAGGGAAGLAASSPHWARARAPQPFAAALAGAGAPAAERGAFAARAALQIMAAAEPGGAVDAAGDAKALLDAAETPAGDVYTSFASLFAQALAKGSPALAATLAREYGPALERTDDLPALAERACGAAFVAAGGGPPGLGELLRAMGGGG